MSPVTRSPQAPLVPFDANWKNILECASLEVFEMMAGARLQSIPPPSEDNGCDQTAMVGMAGALCGMTTLRCSHATASKLASLMLGGDTITGSYTLRDALGELCNMIAGNFKAKVSTLGDHCMLSVPTVISGTDYVIAPTESNERVTVTLTFADATIWISLVAHQ